ncbi:hypothetical protein [Sphingomonas sp.]|jgi:hypothetical protein|uniref:hypothetical protein n=1 Tax=Sphingomonas sp. TaxID=28214 RepID=UPI0035C7F3BD
MTDTSALLEELIRRAGGGAIPPLPPNAPGLTSGGMDPWQTSVEKRLDSLDGRVQRLEADVSTIKVDMGVVKERVSHLPTKEYLVKVAGGMLALIATLVTFGEKLQSLVR